jgi:hypothetical protein
MMEHIHISPSVIAITLGAISTGKRKSFIPIIITIIMVKKIQDTTTMWARGHNFHFFISFSFGNLIIPSINENVNSYLKKFAPGPKKNAPHRRRISQERRKEKKGG